jgi:hypothetical protein
MMMKATTETAKNDGIIHKRRRTRKLSIVLAGFAPSLAAMPFEVSLARHFAWSK